MPWLDHPPFGPDEFAHLRRRLIFDCFKWDPQSQDVSVLSPLPVVLKKPVWEELGDAAEALYAEALACEEEILGRPELVGALGLPGALTRALVRAVPFPRGPRVMRFDFHPTRDGWRVSEVNADVPGGYIEASAFPKLAAPLLPGTAPPGDPTSQLADLVGRCAPGGRAVALVHATAYADDAQVMCFLSGRLRAAGVEAVAVGPQHVVWEPDGARVESAWWKGPVGAVFRFFPAEWLPQLPRITWKPYFGPTAVPHVNPATSILLQSKRFPLLWSEMRTSVPAWKRFLPETVDPRDARLDDGTWVLKSCLGRVGDGVGIPGVTPVAQLRKMRLAVKLRPSSWVAQRRFESWGRETERGPMHLCIGVFVVDGRAAGAYGRAAARPLIDASAMDVAILVAEEAP